MTKRQTIKKQNRFEMYPDCKGEWRFRFVFANGEKAGDGYKRPSECRKQLDRFLALAPSAPIVNLKTGVVFYEGVRDN